jgi:hypothetical protein
MWSRAVFDPALPGLGIAAKGSPEPAWQWSKKARNGWNLNPFFRVGPAPCLSEWAATSVASKSTTSGSRRVFRAVGEPSPAKAQVLARAAALVRPAAGSTLAASAPKALNSLETVASEGTWSHTVGSERARAASAKQSPPAASTNATSNSVFAGSWTAPAIRHVPNTSDNPAPSPETRAASASNTPSAGDTDRDFPARPKTLGYAEMTTSPRECSFNLAETASATIIPRGWEHFARQTSRQTVKSRG